MVVSKFLWFLHNAYLILVESFKGVRCIKGMKREVKQVLFEEEDWEEDDFDEDDDGDEEW